MPLATPPTTLRSHPGTSPRLLERPFGPHGPGRAIERWLCLWRWETWASESPLARRPRAGWSLTYGRALIASQDALDDYELSS
jgi:hypothetical protein